MTVSFELPGVIYCSVTLLLLAGCSQEPPKCGNDETVRAVKSLFLEQLDQAEALKKAGSSDLLAFEHPRAVAYDESVKRRTCATTLKIAGKLEYPLEYTSQLDDAGNHLVSIDKLSLADMAVVMTAIVQSLNNDAATAGKAPASDPADVQSSSPGLAVTGRWEGDLEGRGWMDVSADAGGLAVDVGVGAPSGCRGSLSGRGVLQGSIMTVSGNASEASCILTVKFSGTEAEVSSGEDCSYYHGAACGFNGTLRRVR